MPSEDVQVALERKADTEGLRVGKDLRQDVVQEGTSRQRHQVNQVGRVLVTELEQGWPHRVELGHGRPPLGVHPDDRLSNELLQLLAFALIPDKLHLHVGWQS